jgi:ATP-dependent Clp protease adaptor protein ClpS
VPNEQDDQCADNGANQARALIGPVPTDRLADKSGDESAGDAEQRRENETGWIIWSRRQQARDDAGDKTDDDHPDNVHSAPRENSQRMNWAQQCWHESGHQRHTRCPVPGRERRALDDRPQATILRRLSEICWRDVFEGLAMTKTIVAPRTKTKTKTQRPPLYKVILLNDDYTPREFVVLVLKAVFRMSGDQAYRVMMTAHQRGACVIAVYTRDVAETKAKEGTELGKSKGYPLFFTTEPEQ